MHYAKRHTVFHKWHTSCMYLSWNFCPLFLTFWKLSKPLILILYQSLIPKFDFIYWLRSSCMLIVGFLSVLCNSFNDSMVERHTWSVWKACHPLSYNACCTPADKKAARFDQACNEVHVHWGVSFFVKKIKHCVCGDGTGH